MHHARHTPTIVHAVPWRVHLRCPALIGRRAAAARVADELVRETGARVRARATTGSVVVTSREQEIDARALARRLGELVAAERDEHGRPLRPPRPGHAPGPTRLAQTVAHAVVQLNHDVRTVLDDHADLATLLSLLFAAGGVAEVARSRELPTPPWFNLAWWSLRSFMTFNREALRSEADAWARELDEEAQAPSPDEHARG